MSFETLGGARPKVLRPQHETENLPISFINDSGETLTEGQEVILKTDGTIDLREVGTEFPIGVVEVGGEDSERVTVGTYLMTTLIAIAHGAALDAGDFVVPNGDKTSGVPQVVEAADGDYVSMVVLKGGLSAAQILVGVLRSPFKLSVPES